MLNSGKRNDSDEDQKDAERNGNKHSHCESRYELLTA